MTIYSVIINEKEKTFTTGRLDTSIEDFLDIHSTQVFQFTDTVWVAFKSITYTDGSKKIDFPQDTRFHTHELPLDNTYQTFTKNYVSIMRGITDPNRFGIKNVTAKTCIPTGTVYLHKIANDAIIDINVLNPEDSVEKFTNNIQDFFCNYPSYRNEIRTTCRGLELVFNSLGPEGRTPYDFLETAHIDENKISELMKKVFPLIFNDNREKIATQILHYQTYVKEMDMLFSASEYKIKPKKIAESEDNTQTVPSDKALSTIFNHLEQIKKAGASSEETKHKISKYRKALDTIMQTISLAHTAAEFVICSLLKYADPIGNVLSIKTNPNDFDKGTKIIGSIIWAVLQDKTAELKECIQISGYELFLKTQKLTENDQASLTSLGVKQPNPADPNSPSSVFKAMMDWVFEGKTLFIKHNITKKSILFDPKPFLDSPVTVYMMTCSNEFFSISLKNIAIFRKLPSSPPLVQKFVDTTVQPGAAFNISNVFLHCFNAPPPKDLRTHLTSVKC